MSCDTLEEFNDIITKVCVVDEVNFINDFIYEELEFKDCKEFTSVLKQENKNLQSIPFSLFPSPNLTV